MKFWSLTCRLAVAGIATLSVMATPNVANAQDLFGFLWGGSAEWGGGRQTVSFPKQYTTGQLIVSFGDRRLYHVVAPGKAMSYPIAIPREQSRWQGVTSVTSKRINPSWTPTPEMIRENPRLPRWVPGGHPMNPLGNRALYLGSSTYRIHGTDAPWTIGKAVSKGCIRMYNEDVAYLYPRVNTGAKVTVTWQRFQGGSALFAEEETPRPRQGMRRVSTARLDAAPPGTRTYIEEPRSNATVGIPTTETNSAAKPAAVKSAPAKAAPAAAPTASTTPAPAPAKAGSGMTSAVAPAKVSVLAPGAVTAPAPEAIETK